MTYEVLDYGALLARIGIDPGSDATWFCGANQAANPLYDQPNATYDQPGAGYLGASQSHPTLCLTEDINVNGLLLNHRDANGTIWLCTEIEGWWTTPPSDIADIPTPYWDGSMLTTGRYTSRTITISGCFIPPNPSLVWYNRDAIIRASTIVRGVGLLAMCGNESPHLKRGDPFFDPPKMATIQSNDVPLIETLNTSGFTQFSISFRCANPTKMSIKQQELNLVSMTGDRQVNRYYKAFSLPVEPQGHHVTRYSDLYNLGDAELESRSFAAVLNVNYDAPIDGEELTEPSSDPSAYYTVGGGPVPTIPTTDVYNAGNYFAFPVFVIKQLNSPTTTANLTVNNYTTGESMKIQKRVPQNWQLVIDTGMRRVAMVDPDVPDPRKWTWDDRSALTLTSQWVSLAPGHNEIAVIQGAGNWFPAGGPKVYWRDTWIG